MIMIDHGNYMLALVKGFIIMMKRNLVGDPIENSEVVDLKNKIDSLENETLKEENKLLKFQLHILQLIKLLNRDLENTYTFLCSKYNICKV